MSGQDKEALREEGSVQEECAVQNGESFRFAHLAQSLVKQGVGSEPIFRHRPPRARKGKDRPPSKNLPPKSSQNREMTNLRKTYDHDLDEH